MASDVRVITVSTPKRRASASSFCATARLISLSSAPPAVEAPPSSPPWPASMTSVGLAVSAIPTAGRASSPPPRGSRKQSMMSAVAAASGIHSRILI